MLHHKIHGSGEPIILLHGYLSSSHYWNQLVDELAKEYRVITIDLLGFGKSPKPRRNTYTLDEHAQAVHETINVVLDHTAHFSVVAHSMGGLVASKLSLLEPQRTTKLILCNMPVFTSDTQARHTFEQTSRLYKTMLYSKLGRAGWPLLKLALAGAHPKLAPKALRPIIRSSMHSTHTSRSRSLRNTIEQTNGLSLLSSLTSPTHYIGGLQDRPIYATNLAASTLPSNITVEWANTGHHTPIKAPEYILRLLHR